MKKRISAIFIALILIIGIVPVSSLAAGSIYVSTDYIELSPGESSGVNLTAEQIAGGFSISKSGPISISPVGDIFLDDESVWIDVVAEGTGTGYIYIDAFDAADYDENDLTGWGTVITVEITDPNEGYNGGGDTIIYDETDPDEGGNDDHNDDYNEDNNNDDNNDDNPPETESTTPEPDLSVVIGTEKYTIMKYISDLNAPSGFTESKAPYNDTEVPVFVCGDVTAYVLQNESTHDVDLFIFNPTTKQFTMLPFIQHDDTTYVILDAPAGFSLPEGYKHAELKLENCQAKVIQRSDADFKDFYYMYCMVNGEKGWYSYDSAKDTFQRMVKFETIQKETEPETTTPPAHQEGKGWAALSKTTKMLLALLVLAILIIIALLIALIVTNRKRKPKDTPPEGDAPKTPAEKLFAEEEAAAAATETQAAEAPAEEPPAAEPPEENPAADHADILEELSLDDAVEAPVEAPAESHAPDPMDMEKTIEELTLEIEDEIKGN
ncbi:MAG: hypothetical protein IJM53_06885 [Lachnospiraceae bacterium]|nr:hypothetical protein [Lachnospiraceae bacterium]